MTTSRPRYRVGIIACGNIAQLHLRSYRGIPEVEVVAGADISPQTRERWEKELIDSGAIGTGEQITVYNSGGDLITSSSHMVDVMRYLLGDPPAQWVIGQIDTRDPGFTDRPVGLQHWEETHIRYGHHVETGAGGIIRFQGGVQRGDR